MSETNRAVENEVWERRLRVLETCLGRSIMQYMHDDNVTEVMVNPDGRLWLDTFDKGVVPTDVVMEPEDTKRIIYMVADISGQVIDLKVDPSLHHVSFPTAASRQNCRRSSTRRALTSASTPRSSSPLTTMCGREQ